MGTDFKQSLVKALLPHRRYLGDSRGYALVTSLMFTLISLTIVTALMYVMTMGTKVSATNKRYKTAIEASYGGADVFTKDVIPFLLQNYTNPNLATATTSAFSAVNLTVTNSVCLKAKLLSPSNQWPASCSNTPRPTDNPDITFDVLSVSGNPYKIYSKIVETKVGNSDVSGLQLEGSGVAESTPGITPQHNPYIYRLEVQGSQSTSTERANIDVLYAY